MKPNLNAPFQLCYLLGGISPGHGLWGPCGNGHLNHGQLDDDTFLVSETSKGLQTNLDIYVGHLGKMGLYLNAGKSCSLRIGKDQKRKRWFLDWRPLLRVADQLVLNLDVADMYCYLGVKLGATGT